MALQTLDFNHYLGIALPLIMLSFGIHAFYTGLQYMWGNFLNNPQAYARAKDEVASLIRTIGIFAFVIIIYNILILGFGMDFLLLAKLSVKEMFWRLVVHYSNLWLYELIVGAVANFGVYIPIPIQETGFVLDIGGPPLIGLTSINLVVMKAMEPLYYAITLAGARYMLLDFAPVAVIYILPLGFILRAFPLTRKTGSSLIALSITLYFVYPLSILLSDYMLGKYDQAKVWFSALPKNPHLGGENEREFVEAVTGYLNVEQNRITAEHEYGETTSVSGEHGFFNSLVQSIRNFFISIWNVLKGIFGFLGKFLSLVCGFYQLLKSGWGGDLLWNPAGWVGPLIVPTLWWVSVVAEDIAVIFIVFILEITISITMYRNLALILGGELRILGITKVTG